MVKRLLSLAIVVLTAILSVQAQQLQRDPSHISHQKTWSAGLALPRKVASLEGTITFGYSTSGVWGGLGVGQTGVAFDVAIFIPGDALAGASVQGVNIPVIDAGMKDVTVWARSALNGENLGEGTTTGPFTENDYLAVPFEEGVEIPSSGIYVGYSFVGSTTYPVAIDYYDAPVPNGLFLQYSNTGWVDYSTQFSASALEVFLTDVAMPDYSITINSVGNSTQAAGTQYSLPVNFVSNSANAIESLDVDVTIDGETKSSHIKLSTAVPSGFTQPGTFTLQGTAPANTGLFKAEVKVTKVNDENYDGEATGSSLLKNVTKVVPRRTVIEEFTGTGCGYCPRGWAGMEYMKEHHPDDFIGIAFHKYNSSDPLYPSTYPMLGLTGAPGCVIDRKETADPYYGVGGSYALGIEDDFKRLNAEVPEVDVTVSAAWNEAQTSVNITADVEFLIAPQNLSLVYVLTADSLRGTTSAWQQINYYASYTKAQLAGQAILEEFGQGGIYGQSSVLLTFNDAVIGSSYYSTGSVNRGETVTSEDGYEAGDVFQGTYTISQPSSTAVRNVLNKELVFANVLVIDNETGYILNAARAHVTGAEPVDAVQGLSDQPTATVSARYNMAGQTIAAPQRGVNLQRMSDGSVRKVLVK